MKAISYRTLFIGLFSLSITPALAQHPEPTLLRDVNPGPGDGTRYLQVIHGKIFFVGDNGVNGGEPWISDGTTGGTQMIKNINTPIPGYPYDQGSVPSNAVSLNTKISFLARYESEMGTNEALFLTDGTEAGTIKYADNIGAEWCVSRYDKLYFNAWDATHGRELWKSDGTAAGTTMIKDINPGAGFSFPSYLTVVDSKVFFQASNGISGAELWVTDGTTAGTNMVKDINPSGASSPSNFVAFAGKLFFVANHVDYGSEIWTSDGTAAGTTLFKDIHVGVNGSYPSSFTIVGDKMYFIAYTIDEGSELWVTDGTADGTYMVKDINPGAEDGAFGYQFIQYNGKIFFCGRTTAHGIELWVTDGTEAGTYMYLDLEPGSGGSLPNGFKVYNNRLYFTANTTAAGNQLWCIEGESTTAQLVRPADADVTASCLYASLVVLDGSLYFDAHYSSSIGKELYKIQTTPFVPTSADDVSIEEKQTTVYPNPAQTSFMAENKQLEFTTIAVYNILGQLIYQEEFSGANHATIHCATWAPGYYSVRLKTKNGLILNKKIVKQ